MWRLITHYKINAHNLLVFFIVISEKLIKDDKYCSRYEANNMHTGANHFRFKLQQLELW